MKLVVVSGGFDPLHIGHIRLFQDAARHGDSLCVIVNNDAWLRKKKGYSFMPEDERCAIIEALECVSLVIKTDHEENDEDTSVVDELLKLKAIYHNSKLVFANGGDRKQDNVPEYTFCEENGIEMVFGVGGEKAQSSSELVEAAMKQKKVAYKDACYVFEIARYQDGMYAFWSHGLMDKHKNLDMQDMDIITFLNGLSRSIGMTFWKYMHEYHENKLLKAQQFSQKFPDATKQDLVTGEYRNYGSTMRELSDEELKERFKK